MKINFNINIKNKVLFAFIFTFIFLIGTIFAGAYGTTEPSIFGHTVSELAAGVFGGSQSAATDVWAFQEGKVGIGTTTPTESLDVAGNTVISGNLGTHGYTADCPNGWGCGVHTWDVWAEAAVRGGLFCLGGGVSTDSPGTCITSWDQVGSWQAGAHCGIYMMTQSVLQAYVPCQGVPN